MGHETPKANACNTSSVNARVKSKVVKIVRQSTGVKRLIGLGGD